jgi:ribosomal protein S18 acetylase RimI-like enzyme
MARSLRVTVRPARPGDLSFLADNHRAMAWETERKRLAPAVVRSGTRAVLRDGAHGFYLVAEADGRPAGQLLVTREWSDWRDGDLWWIQSVYVRPGSRRLGVYGALHAAVLERAARARVRAVRLYVERTNRGAQATYRRLGMTRTGYLVFEQPVAGATRGAGRRR